MRHILTHLFWLCSSALAAYVSIYFLLIADDLHKGRSPFVVQLVAVSMALLGAAVWFAWRFWK